MIWCHYNTSHYIIFHHITSQHPFTSTLNPIIWHSIISYFIVLRNLTFRVCTISYETIWHDMVTVFLISSNRLQRPDTLIILYNWNKTCCAITSSRLHLSNWGRLTHICVGKLTIIGSDDGLSPGRRQAIIWTNAGILLIGPMGTNFSDILIAIETFSFKKMHWKISSAKWRPFCLGLNVLTYTHTSLDCYH